MTDAADRTRTIEFRSGTHWIAFEPSPKRVRVMFNGKTVADTLSAGLLREPGRRPIYYFPRQDVRMDLLQPSDHTAHCPYRGAATYRTLAVAARSAVNAVWSYEAPPSPFEPIADLLAFDWNKVDHWFEEDEEIFGHARDPYHRVDIRPSTREVRVQLGGETIALTRRAMFLFETGHPTRYYIPPDDVRMDLLTASRTRTTCPYKGHASYRSAHVGDRAVKDIAWCYADPLPESVQIKGHFCFYPERVEALQIEGAN